MIPGTPSTVKLPEKVTLLVFKDNDAARTFHVPLKWVSHFGIALSLLLAFAFGGTYFGIKYYRIAARSNPLHVQELEQEIGDLKANLKNLELKTFEPVAQNVDETSHSGPNTTPTPSASSGGTHASQTASVSTALSIFPTSTLTSLGQFPDPQTIAISIQPIQTKWIGNKLTVQFALQYNRGDHGNQEGRILILARGPDSLLSYPSGTLNHAGTDHLISPSNGEFFSVSRFREVKAEFGPVKDPKLIEEVEVYLFGGKEDPLAYRKVPIKKTNDEDLAQ